MPRQKREVVHQRRKNSRFKRGSYMCCKCSCGYAHPLDLNVQLKEYMDTGCFIDLRGNKIGLNEFGGKLSEAIPRPYEMRW